MPQVPQLGHVQRKRFLIIGGLALALVVIGGGFWAYTLYENNLASQQFAQTKAATEQLESTNKFAKAADQWMALAQSIHGNTYRGRAWKNAAADYMTAGNFKAALSSYHSAMAITGVTIDEAEGAAIASAQLGQKSQAIGYYQQAIALIPKNLTGAQFQKAILEQAISRLQDQP